MLLHVSGTNHVKYISDSKCSWPEWKCFLLVFLDSIKKNSEEFVSGLDVNGYPLNTDETHFYWANLHGELISLHVTRWTGYVNSNGRGGLRGLRHIWKRRILEKKTVLLYLFNNGIASYSGMINVDLIGKDVGKKWSWPNLRHYSVFAWRDWGNERQTSVAIVFFFYRIELRNGHLTKTSHRLHHLRQLVQ
jgi:hypothetical protein